MAINATRNQLVRGLFLIAAILVAFLSVNVGRAFAQDDNTYPNADEFGSWDATGTVFKWHDIAELNVKAMLDPGSKYQCSPYMTAHGCINLSEVEFTRLADGGLTWTSPNNGTLWTVVRIPDGMPMFDGWVSNNDPNRPVAERFKVSGNYRGTPDTGDGCGRTIEEIKTWGQPDGHRFTGVPSGVVVPVQGITIQGETRYGVEFDHARTRAICQKILGRMEELILADENGNLLTAEVVAETPSAPGEVTQAEADLTFCRENPSIKVRDLDCPALLAAVEGQAPANSGWTWWSWTWRILVLLAYLGSALLLVILMDRWYKLLALLPLAAAILFVWWEFF